MGDACINRMEVTSEFQLNVNEGFTGESTVVITSNVHACFVQAHVTFAGPRMTISLTETVTAMKMILWC